LFQRGFEHAFERLRAVYRTLLETLVHRRLIFIPCFLVLCLSGTMLIPWLGQDFFPATDNGQFMLHVRAKTGTRIEETARLCDLVENSIRGVVPANEIDNILDNIGLPYSSINYLHGSSGVLGASEADVLVSLHEKHHPTAGYVAALRNKLPVEFPGTTFYFLPADMVTQILNFGLPAPIDVQIEGADVATNRNVAD
jgi:multidrug efflux pump subunit AcrB